MADNRNFGVYLPTTAIYDPESLARFDSIDPVLKEFIIVTGQYYNNIANVLNLKETGYYITTEIVNSQLWFRTDVTNANQSIFRNAFRMVVDFGALPNTTTKSVAHNIPGLTAGVMSWTRIYGASTDPSANGLPLPYASNAPNTNIELSVDITNVNVTTAMDYSDYTITYIVLEYLKN